MNTEGFGALIVRMAGLGWIFQGVDLMTYLPRYLSNARNAELRHATNVAYYQAESQAEIVRVLLPILFGIVLFVGWRRVVKFLVKDVPMLREETTGAMQSVER